MRITPQLPAAYQLEQPGEVDCLRHCIGSRARDGAAEGTLVFATNLIAAKGYQDKSWQGFADNFHAAILLEPEFEAARFQQMQIVGVVSLGNSIATHVAPMTSLTYGWPNNLYIAGQKIAAVWLDQGVVNDKPWLSITASVNVMHAPGDDSGDFFLETMSLREAEGNSDITAELLLETWSRQFIAEINNWNERGFEHILGYWNVRADSMGNPISWFADCELNRGIQRKVLADGSLQVELDTGDCTELTVWQYANAPRAVSNGDGKQQNYK